MIPRYDSEEWAKLSLAEKVDLLNKEVSESKAKEMDKETVEVGKKKKK